MKKTQEDKPDYWLALRLELLLRARGAPGDLVPLNVPTACQQLGCSVEALAAAFEELTRQGVVNDIVSLPFEHDGAIHFQN